ncbi:hypothetical protein, partial [Brucella anthropi]|uniref:hypothetical protein n=1 Tax=Brucella anthropi TaxID=529 RepID=UPI001AED405B
MMGPPRAEAEARDDQGKHHCTHTCQPRAKTRQRQADGEERRRAADRGEDGANGTCADYGAISHL